MLKIFKKKQKPEVVKRTVEYNVFTKDGFIECKAHVEDEKDLANRLTNILDIGGWFYVVSKDGERIILHEDNILNIVVKGDE
jgi:hypothetical protein